MTERERDEEIEHRSLTRMNRCEHQYEAAVEQQERDAAAAVQRQHQEMMSDEDAVREAGRFWRQWAESEATRRLDEPGNFYEGI